MENVATKHEIKAAIVSVIDCYAPDLAEKMRRDFMFSRIPGYVHAFHKGFKDPHDLEVETMMVALRSAADEIKLITEREAAMQ